MWVHHLVKGRLDDKGRIGSKVVLKVEVERSQVEKRPRKQRKCSVTSSDVQIMVNWAIEKTAPSVVSMVQRKGKCSIAARNVIFSITILTNLFACRKRKPRKNTTKGWFPKEASTSSPPPPPTSQNDAPSPPRLQRRAVRKLTPKKLQN
jgi:hypothetical protein